MFGSKSRHPAQCLIRNLECKISIAHQTLPQELDAMVHMPLIKRRIAWTSSVTSVVRCIDCSPVDVADGILVKSQPAVTR